MKKVLIILSFILLIVGCENKNNNVLDSILEENNYIVVDVRTNVEYESGHVVGSINIPYDEIQDANLDKNVTILVYCKSGARSSIAYETLKKMGYDVYNLGPYDDVNLEKG